MGFFRPRSAIVEAQQVCVFEGIWPEQVTRWEQSPDGSFGFVGSGEGIQHVWAGDWIIFSLTGPCRVCRPYEFSKLFEALPDQIQP